jgi:hypothetical protein
LFRKGPFCETPLTVAFCSSPEEEDGFAAALEEEELAASSEEEEFSASLEEERFAAMPEEESVFWYSSQVSRSMGLSGSEQEKKMKTVAQTDSNADITLSIFLPPFPASGSHRPK